MQNYKDPTVELIPGAEGLDLAVQTVQRRLAEGLPWLTKAFGRATKQISRPAATPGMSAKAAKKDIYFPEVYYKQEPYNCMPNDNLAASCFFLAHDPLRFLNYEPMTSDGAAEQDISIIFWGNLSKIDNRGYNYSNILLGDVYTALKRSPGLKLQEAEREFNKVFNPFTIGETYRVYQKPPYFSFRFNGTISFQMKTIAQCLTT